MTAEFTKALRESVARIAGPEHDDSCDCVRGFVEAIASEDVGKLKLYEGDLGKL